MRHAHSENEADSDRSSPKFSVPDIISDSECQITNHDQLQTSTFGQNFIAEMLPSIAQNGNY